VDPSVALGKAKQGDAVKRSLSVLYSSSKPRGTSVWLDPLQASRRPTEEEKEPVVLSDSHLTSCIQGASLIPLHLLARKIEREAPSIRKHSKGRKAADFSTGFVVTHFHLIGFLLLFWFFQARIGFGAPTSSSGDLNLSVNHTVSQMDSSSEGGILVIGNLDTHSYSSARRLCTTR